jgi:hypothetical protein
MDTVPKIAGQVTGRRNMADKRIILAGLRVPNRRQVTEFIALNVS